MKKYEITEIAHASDRKLHRIRALIQVKEDVPPGTIGGFVQSEDNLSQEDDGAWIFDDAVCRDDASVQNGAALYGNAHVSGRALVSDGACVSHMAYVKDDAIVIGSSIEDMALVCGNGRVIENVATHATPKIYGRSVVMGTAAGAVFLGDRAFILPGQTVDNPLIDTLHISEKRIVLANSEFYPMKYTDQER